MKKTKRVKKIKKAKKKVAIKKKNGLISITSPIGENVKVMVASELADDEMIENEMMGEILPFFVYKFTQDGKDVVGLTVKGVNEVVRRINRNPKSGSKIHINPKFLMKEEVEREGEKGIEVSVFAEDLVSGNSAWGIKFEPYFKTGRNGKYKNTFAVEKALSKAERNARRKLISETLAVKMIEKLLKEPNTVKQIEAPAFQVVEVKPIVAKASTPEELVGIIMQGIKNKKSITEVIDFDEKAQKDPRLTKNLREAIHKSAVNRVSELEKNEK